jgi:hypothetical protein
MNNQNRSTRGNGSPDNRLVFLLRHLNALAMGLGVVVLVWMTWNSSKNLNGDNALRNAIPSNSLGGFVSDGPVSGGLFKGTPFRKFQGKRIFTDGWRDRVGKNSLDWNTIVSKYYSKESKDNAALTKKCVRWAVVTTIFEINECILRVAKLEGWCTVIVADNKTPEQSYTEHEELKGNDSVFYFSVKEQLQWLKLPGELGKFVQVTPFNHFARKNLGFLYAILRGGEFIFDFDDDNFINQDAAGKTLSLIPNEKEVQNVRFISLETKVFNHHPLMGATLEGSWPRGFPLEKIQDTKAHGKVVSSSNKVAMEKIGVIQFMADHNPDIDAVHRLVKPLPMSYTKESKSSSILVPSDALVPYNAQATIHTKDSFFATLLPVTVMGRVTDIWRSYFAECLFRDLDLAVILAPPRITQIRNVHSYIADMKAEEDLYYKSERLSEFLSNWKSSSPSLPARMEELWIGLYERGYMEEGDVNLVQLWLGALVQCNYKFRTPTNYSLR